MNAVTPVAKTSTKNKDSKHDRIPEAMRLPPGTMLPSAYRSVIQPMDQPARNSEREQDGERWGRCMGEGAEQHDGYQCEDQCLYDVPKTNPVH